MLLEHLTATTFKPRRLLVTCLAVGVGVMLSACGSAHLTLSNSVPTHPVLTYTTSSTVTATPQAATTPESFLRPLPAVTIGNEESGRWSVVLDTALVSAQPIPGSTPFNPHDRLLEMRVTATYLTPGPPGNPAFVVSNLQLDELPQDLGLSHVPTDAEEGTEEAERCNVGGIKDLCDVAKYGDSELVLDADDEGTPGGATTTEYLDSVESNRSESFWVIAHVSEKVNPTHIGLVLESQPLTVPPKG